MKEIKSERKFKAGQHSQKSN